MCFEAIGVRVFGRSHYGIGINVEREYAGCSGSITRGENSQLPSPVK
jgi:hypothetical protein